MRSMKRVGVGMLRHNAFNEKDECGNVMSLLLAAVLQFSSNTI